MIYFPLLFALFFSVECSGSQWYPFMVPVHTGGHHHRHTTHVVTHPIIHTRVLVLGDDEHHHHHKHNHGHNHLHKHGHDHKHDHLHKHGHQHRSPIQRSVQQQKVNGLSNAHVQHQSPRYGTQQNRGTHARHYDSYSEDGEGPTGGAYQNGGYDDRYSDTYYSNDGDSDHSDKYSSEEPIKYSVPVHESPWKPLHHLPQRYLPLKHLGLDEERVVSVVKQAISEIDKDMAGEEGPVSYNSYHSPSTKSPSSLHHGAVYYDDPTEHERHGGTQLRYGAGNYDYPPKGSRTFKVNFDCQCEVPYSK